MAVALLEQNGLVLCVELDLEMRCASSVQLCRCLMPILFQGVHSMQCFVRQDSMVLMSRFVRDAMRPVRAASSGDELDV